MAVYFIQAGKGGPIKIGLSQCVERRCANMQTGNHLLLTVIGVIADGKAEDEAFCHRKFHADRLHGEWFAPSGLLVHFINNLHLYAPKKGDDTVHKTFSMKQKTWREREGLTQAEMGERLGVSQVAVGRYETGRTPKEPVMIRIIKVTKGEVTPNDYYGLTPADPRRA